MGRGRRCEDENARAARGRRVVVDGAQALPPHLPSPHLPSILALSLWALNSSASMKPSPLGSCAPNCSSLPSWAAANSALETLSSLSVSILSTPHWPSPLFPSAVCSPPPGLSM